MYLDWDPKREFPVALTCWKIGPVCNVYFFAVTDKKLQEIRRDILVNSFSIPATKPSYRNPIWVKQRKGNIWRKSWLHLYTLWWSPLVTGEVHYKRNGRWWWFPRNLLEVETVASSNKSKVFILPSCHQKNRVYRRHVRAVLPLPQSLAQIILGSNRRKWMLQFLYLSSALLVVSYLWTKISRLSA